MLATIIFVIVVILFLTSYACYRLAVYWKPAQRPGPYVDDHTMGFYRAFADQINGQVDLLLEQPFEEVRIESQDGLVLTGRYFHVADGAPVWIFVHVIKGVGVRDFAPVWHIARELGHNFLLVDQRACGGSQGYNITYGVRERYDVQSWVAWACQRFGAETPLFLYGVSMGAATVCMTSDLELPENLLGVVSDCAYTSPLEIIAHVGETDMHLPMSLLLPFAKMGTRLFAHCKLEGPSAVSSAAQACVPLLVIHGMDDTFVPFEMGKRIFAAAQGNETIAEASRCLWVEGAAHAQNVLVDPVAYDAAVKAFMAERLAAFEARRA